MLAVRASSRPPSSEPDEMPLAMSEMVTVSPVPLVPLTACTVAETTSSAAVCRSSRERIRP